LETVKQSRAAIADLTDDQGVSMVVQTHICHFKSSKAGQCDSYKSVNYVKMGGWYRHVVASISTNKFHWLALIYLVAMIFKHHFSTSRLMAGIIAFV
jgi:predicted cobalt transporter CbtA